MLSSQLADIIASASRGNQWGNAMPDNTGRELTTAQAASFLTDSELREALGEIFCDGSYEQSAIRHASYQLRLGSTVKVNPYKTKAGERLDRFVDAEWSTGGNGLAYVDIYPRQTALLYTQERFQLPSNLVGFIYCRGLLFTKALTPENTYVDPGFDGPLYITVRNESDHIARLTQGIYLARLFIFKLATPVSRAYVTGESLGIEQQLSQIPARKFWPPHELPNLPDEDLMSAIQGGCRIGDLLQQIVVRQNRVRNLTYAWLAVITAGLLVLALWNPVVLPLSRWRWLQALVGEAVGKIIATGLVVLFGIFAPWVFGKRLVPLARKLRGMK